MLETIWSKNNRDTDVDNIDWIAWVPDFKSILYNKTILLKWFVYNSNPVQH